MDQYFKTDLGIQALKQRSFQLNARQRQLLLLIGTDDFKVLNSTLKERLATPELIQQLEELGLIFMSKPHPEAQNNKQTIPQNLYPEQTPVKNTFSPTATSPKETQVASIKVSEKLIETTAHLNIQHIEKTDNTALLTKSAPLEENKPELILMNFDEIKQNMASLLQTHCGLMAKRLVLQIQQAKSIREIKLCQMQWITALQETRFSPQELNQIMQNINYSLQHLHSS
jgi:hypothetical protein